MQVARLTPQPIKLSHPALSAAVQCVTVTGKEENSAAAILRMISARNNVTTSEIREECKIRNPTNIAQLANKKLSRLGLFICATRHPSETRKWHWNIYQLPAANDPIFDVAGEE